MLTDNVFIYLSFSCAWLKHVSCINIHVDKFFIHLYRKQVEKEEPVTFSPIISYSMGGIVHISMQEGRMDDGLHAAVRWERG